MALPSPLDDPKKAGFAWRRYRRLMRRMLGASLVVVCLVLGGLYLKFGPVSIHLYIATGLGVLGTMMLAGALMGLAFLSSGTGHDDSVIDPTDAHWRG